MWRSNKFGGADAREALHECLPGFVDPTTQRRYATQPSYGDAIHALNL
jgi:hypothetical protein